MVFNILKHGHITSIFILFLFQLQAQEQKLVVQVVDENDEGIVGVKIHSSINKSVTYTDVNGFVSLNYKQFSLDTLVFTHLNYKTKSLILSRKSSDTINIKLIKKNKELSEITISSKRTSLITNEDGVHVIDFLICDSGILAIVKKYGSYYLQLYKMFSYVKDAEIQLTKKPIELIRHCNGKEYYFLTKDSLTQISFNKEFSITNSLPSSYYQTNLEPCLYENKDFIYIRHQAKLGFEEYYLLYEKHDSSLKRLYYILNAEGLKAVRDVDIKIKSNPANHHCGDIYPGGPRGKNSNKTRDKIEDVFWRKALIKQQINNFLKESNDTIYLFDHENGILSSYSSKGIIINQNKISYHKNNDWIDRVIKDQFSSKIYTLYRDQNGTSLAEINLQTASTKDRVYLNQHPYPEKIAVANGKAFYISKQNRTSNYKKLFVYKLKKSL